MRCSETAAEAVHTVQGSQQPESGLQSVLSKSFVPAVGWACLPPRGLGCRIWAAKLGMGDSGFWYCTITHPSSLPLIAQLLTDYHFSQRSSIYD